MFRIKAATRALVDRLGGIENAAELVDHGKSSVGRWCHPDQADVIPITCALIMEKEADAPLVTQVMAELNGLKMEKRDATDQGSVSQAYINLTRETAELFSSVALALADGKMTPHEARAVDKEAGEVADALSQMRERLAGFAMGEGA